MVAGTEIDLRLIGSLYREYRDPLAEVRDAQRAFLDGMRGRMTPQLDDIEAEITYLLLRETRPETVMELGTFHGWSTTWILSALRDNGKGTLHSFDIVDNVVANVPEELSLGRWEFHKGDIRENLASVPDSIEYLFVDAAHNGRFAKWYLAELFPMIAPGTPVSVHDVFHGRYALPLTEGAAVLSWLRGRDTEFFTPSRRRAPAPHTALLELREELGLDKPVHTGRNNPMIYFRMPRQRGPLD
ncbi:class I SAM-dependent methyltransferase [Nocardiopsis algeriensis]|uniref:Putative O-methyltransferase YrrM n=1 Tax=Nocardiopsis algeriensis TaxID=1478215 RepID=A0A841IZD0_9ACTN|nr:class I SAM-dependent methyltransferase [Nocardiopsis algeriensis]MBB6121618.1 putative O-methyltransferase YrrM [Nocardiopsis algeriensis]